MLTSAHAKLIDDACEANYYMSAEFDREHAECRAWIARNGRSMPQSMSDRIRRTYQQAWSERTGNPMPTE